MAGFIGTFLAIVGTGMVCCNARCIPAVQVCPMKLYRLRIILRTALYDIVFISDTSNNMDDPKICLSICIRN